MSTKPRNRASLDAEAVARMMQAQDAEAAAEAQPPEAAAASPPPEAVMAAPSRAPAPAARRTAPTRSKAKAKTPPAFDPGKVDGRTLRRTGREPFATRIKPEAHEALKRIAYARGITIAEALELAVAAFASP